MKKLKKKATPKPPITLEEIPQIYPMGMLKGYLGKAMYKRLERYMFGQTMMLSNKELCCYKGDLIDFLFYEHQNYERKIKGQKPLKASEYPVFD
jgi:hypothetical protein